MGGNAKAFMVTVVIGAIALFGLAVPRDGGASAAPANDYPTVARAEYVFACMASNGQTRPMLEKCSCSIDVIASILPYDKYVQAETIARMRQGAAGEKSDLFRVVPWMKAVIDELKQAEAEAEIRCF